jgi:hypothetical protein
MGGGRDAPNPSNEVDSYDRIQNSWTIGGHFLTPRRNFATDTAGECYIYVAGGYASDGVTPLSSMEIFCFPPDPFHRQQQRQRQRRHQQPLLRLRRE